MSCDCFLEMQLFVWIGGKESASCGMETWHAETGVCGLLTNYSVELVGRDWPVLGDIILLLLLTGSVEYTRRVCTHGTDAPERL